MTYVMFIVCYSIIVSHPPILRAVRVTEAPGLGERGRSAVTQCSRNSSVHVLSHFCLIDPPDLEEYTREVSIIEPLQSDSGSAPAHNLKMAVA